MKNKDFFYLQYDKLNWKNQEKTKINSFINDYIIRNILLKHEGDSISVFDIGFGVGFFFKMIANNITEKFEEILFAGCEPSKVNYEFFSNELKKFPENIVFKTQQKTFQNCEAGERFDFITATYVFPHFLLEDMDEIAQKIQSMLNKNGKFILVLAEEKYLESKLKTQQDLFIEKGSINYANNEFQELLHYSDIPEIGKIVDYNREEAFYLNLFENNNFRLVRRENLNDNGFICALFVFENNN